MCPETYTHQRVSVWLTIVTVLLFGLSLPARAGDVWRRGDVFVAINNGQYEIVRVTGSGSGASLQVIDLLNDNTTNSTAGCGFTSMFRPITVSYNASSSLLERYKVSDVGTTHNVVVSTDSALTPNLGLSGKSVALDAQGSIYLGHSGGSGEIDQYIQPAPGATPPLGFALGTIFSIGANKDAAGSEWLDVTSIAIGTANQNNEFLGYNNDLYYTSAGLNVYLVAFATNPKNSPLPTATIPQKLSINLLNFNVPKGFAYHGIKILTDANGNPTSLIVAAGPKIALFKLTNTTTAVLSTVYDYSKVSKTTNFQSVAPDTTGTGFWAIDQGNKNLVHFPVVFSGNPNKFITTVPDTTLALGTTPFGVCVDGSFSPGQPKLQQFSPVTLTPNPDGNPSTNTFSIPILYPNFYTPNQTLPNILTVGVTFTTATSAQVNLSWLDFDPSNYEGVSDDGFACLTSAPPPPLGVVSPYCEVYKVETTPNVGSGFSLLDLDLFLLQQTTSTFGTPPATAGPQQFGTNPAFYHDGSLKLTEGIVQDETRIKSGTGGSGSTVFTVQTQSNTEGISCGYQSPFAPLSTDPTNAPVFGSGSTAGLKFQAALNTTPINCQNGTFLADLAPELKVLKLNPDNLASSTDVSSQFQVAGCSNQCGGLFYTPSGSANNTTWNLQVKMPTGTGVSGSYVAYTVDHNNHIPDFSAYFCIDVCSQPAP